MKTNQSETNNAVSLIKGLVTLFILLQLGGCFDAIGTGGTGSPAYGANGITSGTTIENIADESVAEEEISTAKASLNWTAPVAREDETPISMAEIAGYRVYYGTSQGVYTEKLDVNDAYIDELALEVVAGTYYLVITTVDVDGRESAYSNEIILNV